MWLLDMWMAVRMTVFNASSNDQAANMRIFPFQWLRPSKAVKDLVRYIYITNHELTRLQSSGMQMPILKIHRIHFSKLIWSYKCLPMPLFLTSSRLLYKVSNMRSTVLIAQNRLFKAWLYIYSFHKTFPMHRHLCVRVAPCDALVC